MHVNIFLFFQQAMDIGHDLLFSTWRWLQVSLYPQLNVSLFSFHSLLCLFFLKPRRCLELQENLQWDRLNLSNSTDKLLFKFISKLKSDKNENFN
jgi:hypothetical protein